MPTLCSPCLGFDCASCFFLVGWNSHEPVRACPSARDLMQLRFGFFALDRTQTSPPAATVDIQPHWTLWGKLIPIPCPSSVLWPEQEPEPVPYYTPFPIDRQVGLTYNYLCPPCAAQMSLLANSCLAIVDLHSQGFMIRSPPSHFAFLDNVLWTNNRVGVPRLTTLPECYQSL